MRRLSPRPLLPARRLAVLAVVAVAGVSVAAALGCASLIGAEFDGARLADDAAVDALPASDAPTLADGGTFDALASGDLQLWLAANEGALTVPSSDGGAPADGGTGGDAGAGVGEWRDRSEHGHGPVQADPARRPILVANALAGMSVVRFERGRETCLRTGWIGGPGGKAATAFVVSRGDPTSVVRLQGGRATGAFVFPYNSKLYVPDAAAELNVLLYSAPEQRLARVEHRADTWELLTTRVVVDVFGGVETWRNGKLSEKTSFAGALPSADVLGVGCYAGLPEGLEFADADVAEVLLYATALGEPERIAVEQYLTTKWKL